MKPCSDVVCNCKYPSKFSWQSVKDYFRAWWKRYIVDDYPYTDAM